MTGDTRWLYLLGVAERIAEISEKDFSSRDIRNIVPYVRGVLEVFHKNIDPVSDLEGYAVRRFVRALVLALESPSVSSQERIWWASALKGGKEMALSRTIYITETDLERLEEVLSNVERTPNVEQLEEELARAIVVPSAEVPHDVVTMNSRTRFQDTKTGEEMEVTLCYPRQANFSHGRISVLAPVGSALLGLRVGDEIDWPLPSGSTRSLRVVSVVFQPEAAGRYDL